MRLRSLLLEHYGNFERLTLPLDPAPGCVNLIEAPNGAGKSVLRQAFHDLLFGIDSKTPLMFARFRGERPHLLADAMLNDGEALVFGTRFKQGRVLPDGAPNATVRLSGALDRVTPRQLEHLFALDTQRLRQGGKELASGGDTLGLALLAGTGELTFAKSVRTGLAEKRAALWEAGKTSKPLHRANRAIEQARKSLRDAVRQPKHRQVELDALQAHRDTLEAARADHDRAADKARRLARIDRTRAALTEIAEARDWLAANADAPVLPPGLADELVAMRGKATLAAANLASAEQQALERRRTVADLPRDAGPILDDPRLGALAERLGEIEKSVADSRAVQTQHDRLKGAAGATLASLGCGPEVEAAAVLPPPGAIANARALITRHSALQAALTASEDRCLSAAELLAQLARAAETEAVALPPELPALLREIRADRDPARHAADLARALRAAEAAAAAALAALPGWTGDAATLAAIGPPQDSVITRLDEAVAVAEAEAGKVRAERDRLAHERAQWGRALADLQTTPLPDEAAIARARAARDAGWRLILARLATGAPDPAAEATYCKGELLPARFERHMREADALADRRLLELPRVTEAERLARVLAASDPEWAALSQAVTAAEVLAGQARAEWSRLCRSAGARADSTAAELRAFVAARSEAVGTALSVATANAEIAALGAVHAGWAARLAQAFGVPEAPLPALLALADMRLADSAAADGRRVQHQTRLADAEKQSEAEDRARQKARLALGAWKADWMLALAALARPAAERVSETEAVLRDFETLRLQAQELRGLRERLDGMHQDGAHFAADVASLAADFGMPSGADPFATARALISRRSRAQVAEAAWQQAERARMQAEATLQTEKASAQTARAALDAVLAACGAVDGEDADRRLARSRDRKRFEDLRDRAEAVLRDHGDGLPHATLQTEAASIPPEQMATERQAAEQALSEARARSERAAVVVSGVEQSLSAAARSEDAIAAAAAHTAAIATQSRLLEDYLMLSIASDMLASALMEVEQSAGGAGLRRISAAFEALTCGAHSITAGEIKGGQTVLQAVEAAFPHEWRDIAQLSEGTRDQLYLALRLVAIEDFVASAPPLPFIADDILQTFDDTRARAALEELVRLSQRVQVIVLTHHPHLSVLAAGLPVRVQRLASLAA